MEIVNGGVPIPNQLPIDVRPAIVGALKRYGDWEGDLVVGANHHQTLVTLNERKLRCTLLNKVTRKTADAVTDTIISLLAPFSRLVHTLTTDNGKEFAQHERIAHPYCSWDLGSSDCKISVR